MGEAIGQTLPLGIGIALSPLPIIAVVLMLATPRARANGTAFLLGWLIGLAAVGTIAVLAASGADASDDGAPATWLSWVKLGLGLLLLLLAVKSWRGRPVDSDDGGSAAAMPGWMQALDSVGALKALGMGAALSSVNPKNLMLTLAAGAAIAQTGIGTGQQFAALAVFVVIGTLGPGLPVAIYFLLGRRATTLLDEIKDVLVRHNAVIVAVLMLVIGMKVIGDAVTGLA